MVIYTSWMHLVTLALAGQKVILFAVNCDLVSCVVVVICYGVLYCGCRLTSCHSSVNYVCVVSCLCGVSHCG